MASGPAGVTCSTAKLALRPTLIMFRRYLPMPAFLVLLWAVWPVAVQSGGKLYAPLIVLMGIFSLGSLNAALLKRREGMAFLGLLGWVGLSKLWSPETIGLWSGSLAEGDFAIEATVLRVAVTLIGCGLFLRLVWRSDPATAKALRVWIIGAIMLQACVLVALVIWREELLIKPAGSLFPSAQDMGRNANLLVLALPLLIAVTRLEHFSRIQVFACIGAAGFAVAIAIGMDALAAVLGLVLGAAGACIVSISKRFGFQYLFNFAAVGVLLAPAISWLAYWLTKPFQLPLSTEQRLLIWRATTEKILEKPLAGHGLNASSTWTDTFATRPDLLAQLPETFSGNRLIPTHPHNMALQIWVETGFVGAVLLAVLLIAIGRALPEPQALRFKARLAIGGVFGAGLAFFMVSYSVWDESYWASLTLIVASLIVLTRNRVA